MICYDINDKYETLSQSQVEEERLAFSPTDLLADCGGILGLFIGFNFVMICDLIIFIINKVYQIYF